MSRISCPCSRTIQTINDGKGEVLLGECPECVKNHGEYSKSSAWVESDRDVSQLEKLGKYKPADEEPDHRPLKKRQK
jgi:hypothetical protein